MSIELVAKAGVKSPFLKRHATLSGYYPWLMYAMASFNGFKTARVPLEGVRFLSRTLRPCYLNCRGFDFLIGLCLLIDTPPEPCLLLSEPRPSSPRWRLPKPRNRSWRRLFGGANRVFEGYTSGHQSFVLHRRRRVTMGEFRETSFLLIVTS